MRIERKYLTHKDMGRKKSLNVGLKVATALMGVLLFLSCHDNGEGLYVLYAPLFSTESYLIDSNSNVFHSWSSEYEAAQSAYLQDDGSIVRAGSI